MLSKYSRNKQKLAMNWKSLRAIKSIRVQKRKWQKHFQIYEKSYFETQQAIYIYTVIKIDS